MEDNKLFYNCSGADVCPNKECRHNGKHLARQVIRQVHGFKWCYQRDDLCPHTHQFVQCHLIKERITA